MSLFINALQKRASNLLFNRRRKAILLCSDDYDMAIGAVDERFRFQFLSFRDAGVEHFLLAGSVPIVRVDAG